VRMIVGHTKPEISALRLYQIEIEGFHFVPFQVIGGWESAELQCFVPCCLWKWGFHASPSRICWLGLAIQWYTGEVNIVREVLSMVRIRTSMSENMEVSISTRRNIYRTSNCSANTISRFDK
jgi:hypothetical protein